MLNVLGYIIHLKMLHSLGNQLSVLSMVLYLWQWTDGNMLSINRMALHPQTNPQILHCTIQQHILHIGVHFKYAIVLLVVHQVWCRLKQTTRLCNIYLRRGQSKGIDIQD